MDKLALVGIIIGFGALLGGNALEGGHISALFDLPALIIVIGGTLGAVVLQTPADVLRRAWRMLAWVVQPPKVDMKQQIRQIMDWSRRSRREGLLGLEKILESEKEPFRAKGLALVVDGAEPHTIRRILEVELERRMEDALAGALVFNSLGGYAPTVGIVGAVLGLIQVMGNLADPDQLGPGIATAFVATIYGVASANLIFLPIADRLKSIVYREANGLGLYIEGMSALSEGEHPNTIELRLTSYLGAT